jgi:hypothetical protein
MEYSNWFEYLKSVSTSAKANGTRFSSSWRDFVNLELAMGYFETQTTEPVLDRVRAWVGPRPKEPKDSDGFNALFEQELKRLFSSVLFGKGNMAHFIRNRNLWATAGGSQSRGLLYSDGKVFSKTKWSYAMSLTDQQVQDALYSTGPGHAIVSSVEGAGKDRIIISSDNDLHIKMSYINTIIENPISALFAKLRISSLFYTPSNSLDLFVNEMEKAKLARILKVPVDQSSFDQNQPKEHILIILRLFCDMLPFKEDKDVMRRIIDSVSRTVVSVGNARIPYLYGLLSGWRWTALLGTICNIVSLMCILRRTGVEADFICQGDDVSLHVNSVRDLTLILDDYKLLGYDVNPSKFWISTYRNEFLRRLFMPDGVYGYACRSILSILWKKPQGSFVLKSMTEEFESTVTNWSTLAGRVGIKQVEVIAKKGLLEDLIGLSAGRMSVLDIKDWLLTAKSFGGAGLAQSGHTAVRSTRRVVDDPFTHYRSDSILTADEQRKYALGRTFGRRAKFFVESQVTRADTGSIDNLTSQSFLRSLELVPIEAVLLSKFPSSAVFLDAETNNLSDEDIFKLEEGIRNNFTLSRFDNVWRRLYKGPGSGVLDHIRKEGSVRLLQDFLLGKLSVSAPTVLGANPILVAQIRKFVSDKFFLHLCSRRRLRYDWIRSSLYQCESTIRHIVSHAVSLYGMYA